MNLMAVWSARKMASVAVALMLLSSIERSAPACAGNADTASLIVFAAASLKNALDSVAAEFTKDTGKFVIISYAASPALAKQIEQGAPADVFISANLEWLDYLSQKDMIEPETRVDIVGNRLVLVAPAESTIDLKIAPGFDLSGALAGGKLAIADVKAVPAGQYGKAALQSLGVWPAVEPKIAEAENVRAALALVARGEAPLGIVYQSDAAAEPKVKIIDIFPVGTHPPIVYPGAVTAASMQALAASQFLNYLKTPAAEAKFIKDGFIILN
jgi:molybdate transport system substrate-binding protein